MDISHEQPILAAEPEPRYRASGAIRHATSVFNTLLIRLLQIGAGLGAWHGLVTWLNIDSRIVPAPWDVIRTLYALILNGQMQDAAFVTLEETTIGFLIGSLLGIGLAVALSEVPPLRQLLQPYVVAIQSVPKVAVAPLFLIWFGFDIESKVALVISIMFFPVLVNTLTGLDSVSDEQLELMRALRATRWQTLRRVKIYVALPYLFASFEVCLVLSLTAAVVAEMLGSGATVGLGSLINIYSARMSSAGVFAVLVVLSLLGSCCTRRWYWAPASASAWQQVPGGK